MSRTGSMHPHSLGCEGLQCSNALAWCFLSSSHSTGEATSAPPTPLLLLCAQEGSAGLRQDKTLDKQSSEHGFLCTLAQLSSDSPHPSPHEDTGSIHKARRDVPLKAVQHPNSHQTTGSSRHYGGQKAEYGDESSSDAVKVHVCTRGEGILLQQPQQLLGRHSTVYQLPTVMQALELLTHLSISSLSASQELHVCVQGTWGESRKSM